MAENIFTTEDDYYYNLGVVTQRKSWKPWILFMLEAVETTSLLTSRLIESILAQMAATLEHARAHHARQIFQRTGRPAHSEHPPRRQGSVLRE